MNATVGTVVQMEANARSAVSINTKQAWGMLTALNVRQRLCLRLAASHSQTVFAQKTFICQTTDYSAWDVHQDPGPTLGAYRLPTASATRGGRGKTVTVLSVCLENTKP